MFNFRFRIANFYQSESKHYVLKHGSLSENKAWEFQVSRMGNDLIDVDFDLSFWGQDHAGLNMSFSLFNYTVAFMLYDTRHWNDEENRWYLPGEDWEEIEEPMSFQEVADEWKK